MFKTRPITELRDEVYEHSRGKKDALFDLGLISMNAEGKIITPHGTFDISEHAFVQFVSKLREGLKMPAATMPTNYFKTCPPHLRAQNLNYWIRFYLDSVNPKKDWLFRMKNNTIRAVLSDTYGIFDNESVLDLLYKQNPKAEIQYSYVDDNYLHVRTIENNGQKVGDLDTLYPGFHLSNSEIGNKSIVNNFIIMQLVCTNGLMNVSEYDELFKKNHRAVDPIRIFNDFKDSLEGVDRLKQQENLELFAKTHNDFIYGPTGIPSEDTETILMAARDHLGFNNSYALKAAERANKYISQDERGGVNKYGVISGLTEVARDLPDGNLRYDLERSAGEIIKLDMNKIVEKYLEKIEG